jgi:hypothetical protein
MDRRACPRDRGERLISRKSGLCLCVVEAGCYGSAGGRRRLCSLRCQICSRDSGSARLFHAWRRRYSRNASHIIRSLEDSTTISNKGGFPFPPVLDRPTVELSLRGFVIQSRRASVPSAAAPSEDRVRDQFSSTPLPIALEKLVPIIDGAPLIEAAKSCAIRHRHSRRLRVQRSGRGSDHEDSCRRSN